MRLLEKLYKVLIVWAVLATGFFVIAQDWVVVAHAGLFVGLFGFVVYRYRHKLGTLLGKVGGRTVPGFILLVCILTLIEEGSAYYFGGPESVVHPNFAINILLVGTFWTIWLLTWKLFLARRYSFTEREALLTAGFSSLLYEASILYSSPNAFILFTGIMVLLYAALATLPMQLISFTGTRTSKSKYVISIVLPYLITWPVALVLYAVLTSVGVPI